MKPREVRDLHPRIAHWLDTHGLLYMHEYVSGGNSQIDFVSIQPSTGHVAIIEAKVLVTRYDKSQVNWYHQSFGVADASKLLFSLLPVSEDDIDVLEKHDIEVVHLSMDDPMARIRKLRETAYDFAEVFEATYNKPLKGHSTIIEYLARTFNEQEHTS